MKYTELKTLTEIAQAMDAGLKVEFYSVNHIWTESKKEGIYTTTKYRLVEEEWEPEIDEMVIVVGYDGTEQGERKFKFLDGDKYVCLIDIHHYFSWPEVKPIPEEKPVAQEGWVHPGDIKDPNIKYTNNMLRVRILEDE